MTRYNIEKKDNGYLVNIITDYRTHTVYITNELRELKEFYYLHNKKEKDRLCNCWEGGNRLKDLEITNINETGLTKRDTYALCDLALSQAIVNMLDNAKGVTHYGL